MATSRRRSPSPVAGGNLASSRASSTERSPLRRTTSLRLTRRASAGAGSEQRSRMSARTAAGSRLNLSTSAGRPRASARMPTPIMRQTRSSTLPPTNTRQAPPASPDSNVSENSPGVSPGLTDEELNQLDGVPSLSRRNASRRTPQRVTLSRRPINRQRPNQQQLSWYERLMPECLLTMTSPLTGYETRLESDVEEEEYEILERDRLRRNKRVRRRLMTLVLLAAAASAFMYYQGRFFRRVGVRATMSGFKQRLSNMETGLEKYTKPIQETMGK